MGSSYKYYISTVFSHCFALCPYSQAYHTTVTSIWGSLYQSHIICVILLYTMLLVQIPGDLYSLHFTLYINISNTIIMHYITIHVFLNHYLIIMWTFIWSILKDMFSVNKTTPWYQLVWSHPNKILGWALKSFSYFPLPQFFTIPVSQQYMSIYLWASFYFFNSHIILKIDWLSEPSLTLLIFLPLYFIFMSASFPFSLLWYIWQTILYICITCDPNNKWLGFCLGQVTYDSAHTYTKPLLT